MALFTKAHIKGYLRSDGTFVPDHDDKRAPAKKKPAAPAKAASPPPPWLSSFSGEGATAPKPQPAAVYHPKLNTAGGKVALKFPHKDGSPEAWLGHDHIATVTPGGWLPKSINGVPFAPWDAPKTPEGWKNVPGQMDGLLDVLILPKDQGVSL